MPKKLLIAISLAFICSCSSGGGNKDDNNETPSSSSLAQSSSSSSGLGSSSSQVVSSSSIASCNGFINGTEREHYGKSKKQFCDERDGKKYVYVTIGTQNWMAENLNYDGGNGSKGKCYDNNIANCNAYGRLYNGNEVKTACPVGWHLASKTDWETLYRFIDKASGSGNHMNDPYGSNTAAKYLKAKNSWDVAESGNSSDYADEDTYGFSALPGGLGSSNETQPFSTIGKRGIWWTSTDSPDNPQHAYMQWMYNFIEKTWGGTENKSLSFSARCVKDEYEIEPPLSSSSSVDLCADFADGTEIEHYGKPKKHFCDKRDGKKYAYVTIDMGAMSQTWMAENLNYDDGGNIGKCYGNDENKCDIYGRLYNWTEAMNLPSEYRMALYNAPPGYAGICPSGWHLPGADEWPALLNFIGGSAYFWTHLREANGYECIRSNGISICQDTYGFSALQGGTFYDGEFHNGGGWGYWWSTAEVVGNSAMAQRDTHPFWGGTSKFDFLSVRCIKGE
ncbi:MAG: hypothetical protein FWC26_15050 [Fibromonadales bacterium]|nr:hypothetical protein [Fibromonadales bacterium]